MKKYILRIASIFMVFVLSLILCVSAFAASAPVYDQKTTWWHWVKDVPFLGDWVAYRLGAVCPNSEDKYHRQLINQYMRTVILLVSAPTAVKSSSPTNPT